MGLEILEQLNGEKPTHIFLQAGVGAMAGAIAGFFADCCKDNPPVITVVEPDKADCFYRTAGANDGKLHAVGGDLNTIMAGLACGEPCPMGWEILRRTAENYISMPDAVAARGMRILGNPLPGDERIISGESGAAPLGLAVEALENTELRRKLKLDENSRILCISTEGDTDQENYRRIVWDGAY
jgi:diaminopropionate ammonia-lyase